jgi:hypothetical protein
LKLLIPPFFPIDPFVANIQPGQLADTFQLEPRGALDAFQRTAHHVSQFFAAGFDFCAGLEIKFGIVVAAQRSQRKSAKVICPWIAAAVVDGLRQQVVSPTAIVREISVNSATVQVIEHRQILGERDARR